MVMKVVSAHGSPLDPHIRAGYETRFQHDFGNVRVHSDAEAARSASNLHALAYTVGRDIVFGSGLYAPSSAEGRKLIAHELTHIVQQGSSQSEGVTDLKLGEPAEAAELEADRTADEVHSDELWNRRHSQSAVMLSRAWAQANRDCAAIRRQMDNADSTSSVTYSYELGSGFGVCARETTLVPGVSAGHAFIDAGPYRYGLMKRCQPSALSGIGVPLVTGANLGLPLNPTAAQKTDLSPDPCHDRNPVCVPCKPRVGVGDLASCFRRAYNSYPEKSNYVVYPGPNSNTFAGNLARACCQGMESPPSKWKPVPGWGLSPASAVDATCPPGKSQCEDPTRPDPIGRGLRGLVAGGLLGAAAGAGIGALLSLIPGVGAIAGIGALVGAGVFGGVGLLAGLK
jgi:hypothetical protein